MDLKDITHMYQKSIVYWNLPYMVMRHILYLKKIGKY